MNNLNRRIESGERLVIKAERMRPEFRKLLKRVFIAESGFGTLPDTAGTKIFGYYECDGEHAFIRGNEISVEETEKLQKVQKFVSPEDQAKGEPHAQE